MAPFDLGVEVLAGSATIEKAPKIISGNLQKQNAPFAEHILDWFHVTMRITTLKQMAKRFAKLPHLENLVADLDSVKWYLWHGNVYRALEKIRWLEMVLEMYEPSQTDHPKQYQKLCANVAEFQGYIQNNAYFIPCYSDRYFYGEPISTAFVESAVNEIVSRRMVKKQQMRWTKKEAHLLLQVRTKVLDGELRERFVRWYPGMKAVESELPLAV